VTAKTKHDRNGFKVISVVIVGMRMWKKFVLRKKKLPTKGRYLKAEKMINPSGLAESAQYE